MISRATTGNISAFFIAVVYFFISRYLYNLADYGDIEHYRKFYEYAAGSDFDELFFYQRNLVGSTEPIYGFLVWIGATMGVEHDFYMSFFNASLVFFLVIYLFKSKASIFLIALLLFNFYLFALLTSAERLKFSYLFLFIAMASEGWIKRFFLLSAAWAHFQTVSLYFGLVSGWAVKNFKFKLNFKNILKVSAAIFLAIVFFSITASALLSKLEAYASNAISVFDYINLLILLMLGVFVLDAKKIFFASMTPILFLAVFIGGSRIGITAITIFFYFVFNENKSNHPAVLLLGVYFSLKSFSFLDNLAKFGSGFATG